MVEKVNAIQTTVTRNLVKETDYNTKIKEIEEKITANHDIYITAEEFKKLMKDNFDVRLKEADLVSKKEIADFIK